MHVSKEPTPVSPPEQWVAPEFANESDVESVSLDQEVEAQVRAISNEVGEPGRQLLREFKEGNTAKRAASAELEALESTGLKTRTERPESRIKPLRATMPPLVVEKSDDGSEKLITYEEALEARVKKYWETEPRYTHELLLSDDSMAHLRNGESPDEELFSDGTGESYYGADSPMGQLGAAVWNGAKKGASVEERQEARVELDQLVEEGTALLDIVLLQATWSEKEEHGQSDTEIRETLQKFLTGVTSQITGAVVSAELRDSIVARMQSEIANSNRFKRRLATTAGMIAVGVPTAYAGKQVKSVSEHVPVDEWIEKAVDVMPSIEAVAPHLASAAMGAVVAVPAWVVAKNRFTAKNLKEGIDEWHVDPKKTEYGQVIEATIDKIEASGGDTKLSDQARQSLRQQMRLSIHVEDWLKEYGAVNNMAGQIVHPASTGEGVEVGFKTILGALGKKMQIGEGIDKETAADMMVSGAELAHIRDNGAEKFREIFLDLFKLNEKQDDTDGLDEKAKKQFFSLGKAAKKGAISKTPGLKHAI